MFEHILVPLDGSALAECVLPHLVALAKIGSPRITILRVLDPLPCASDQAGSVDPFDWQLRKVEAETYVRDTLKRLEDAGIQAEGEIQEGRSAEAILELSEERRVDLVLLSSHGQSGLSGWNVSSVVQKVILRVRCSIMIVRAYQPVANDLTSLCYERILLPLDGSPRAEIVLPLAAQIARHHNGMLIAAHIVSLPEMPRRTPLSEEEHQLVRRLIEVNRMEAAGYLEKLPTRLDTPVETHLSVEKNVTDTLRRLVESENVQLVIASAHGYSGDQNIPYGSVVIGFLAYGTVPLLVVQDLPPDRFEPSLAEKALQDRGRR